MSADGTTTAWEYYTWDSAVSWNKRTRKYDFRENGEYLSFPNLWEALNYIGSHGWELVNVYWVPYPASAAVHTFKRPKKPASST